MKGEQVTKFRAFAFAVAMALTTSSVAAAAPRANAEAQQRLWDLVERLAETLPDRDDGRLQQADRTRAESTSPPPMPPSPGSLWTDRTSRQHFLHPHVTVGQFCNLDPAASFIEFPRSARVGGLQPDPLVMLEQERLRGGHQHAA